MKYRKKQNGRKWGENHGAPGPAVVGSCPFPPTQIITHSLPSIETPNLTTIKGRIRGEGCHANSCHTTYGAGKSQKKKRPPNWGLKHGGRRGAKGAAGPPMFLTPVGRPLGVNGTLEGPGHHPKCPHNCREKTITLWLAAASCGSNQNASRKVYGCSRR